MSKANDIAMRVDECVVVAHKSCESFYVVLLMWSMKMRMVCLLVMTS